MTDAIELELAKQRHEALDRIAARCMEALRAVERQATASREPSHREFQAAETHPRRLTSA